MLLHYLGKLKNQKFAILMHIKHVSNVTFLQIGLKEIPNVFKISAKINITQNINILLFCSFTVLNKLKALLLSTVGLSTIKHQHS